MKPTDLITNLHHQGLISDLDRHFSRFLMKTAPNPNSELEMAAVLVCALMREGHICLNLDQLAASRWPVESAGPFIQCPRLDPWCDALLDSGVVGEPGEKKPLVLDRSGPRLYLYRYWQYQRDLAKTIVNRAAARNDLSEHGWLSQRMAQLFGPLADEAVDWQRVAAFAALYNHFCVITGGPGTGKTFTVANILALLVESHATQTPRIALAAPTGKAAARLKESVLQAKQDLKAPGSIIAAMPEGASTIHRLLGTIRNSPYFRHNADHPLALDVLIVDEASMVDLPLMAKLTAALPQDARLILLGDKDQLASVEPGAVLGDICGVHADAADLFTPDFAQTCQAVTGCGPETSLDAPDLNDSIVELKKAYRFKHDSGIQLLSQAVNQVQKPGGLEALQEAIQSVRQGGRVDVKWLPSTSILQDRGLHDDFKQAVTAGLRPYLKAITEGRPVVDEILNAFARFRILCAPRKGPFGVEQLNLWVEKLLQRRGVIAAGPAWYPGRPVMITQNDYQLKLGNGDIGVAWPDPQAEAMRVYFSDEEGRPRPINPQRLPEHETVYAMTVHKSQGSEFDHLILILPDRPSPVVTRELVYTGLTRAKKQVTLFADPDILTEAARNPISRSSGLRELLMD